MGYRLSVAVVVAAALFAVAWVLCNQLAGLGVGGSSVAAGVVAVVAFGLMVRVTRPERPRVRNLRSAHAKSDGVGWQVDAQLHDVLVERVERSGERERELWEKSGVTEAATPHAEDIPARERTRTFLTKDVQFIVDDAGMQVRGKRKTVAGDVWEEHLRIRWSAVRAMGFSTGSYDPVVALYAWAAAGKPQYVVDSGVLSNLQWTQLGELIAEATSGRLILDVASRYDPRSIWPDW
jgi:hypothetical protein